MATALFTNIDLSGTPLGARANVYHSQAFSLTIAQNKLIDLLSFVLVDHANGPKWTKPFVGTNKAAFQTKGGNQHYFRVDETDGSYYADVRMFEAMSDIDTGDNRTPSETTSRWYKGGSTGLAESDWVIVCDEAAMYYGFRAANYAQSDDTFLMIFFGDPIPADPASAFLTSIYSSGLTGTNITGAAATPMTGNAVSGTSGNMYSLRAYNNTGTNLRFYHAPQYTSFSTGSIYITGSTDSPPAPNPASGNIDLAPVSVLQQMGSEYIAVAELPGIFAVAHYFYDTYLIPNYLNLLPKSGQFTDDLVCIRSGTQGLADSRQGPVVISLGDWR